MTRLEFTRRLAETLAADPKVVNETTRLDSLPEWDSMGQVSIVGFLDETLGESLPPGALQRCETIGDLVRLVETKIEP